MQVDELDLQLVLRKWLKEWMTRQVTRLKTDEEKRSQSFVFLDDDTIQMILMMLAMNQRHGWNAEKVTDNTEDRQAVKQYIEESEREWTDLLSRLN